MKFTASKLAIGIISGGVALAGISQLRSPTLALSPTSATWANGQTAYFDPQNISGCASDGNSGLAAICNGSGAGPLVHKSAAVLRWGSSSPVASSSSPTVLESLSADVNGSDPWRLTPVCAGGSFIIAGALTAVATTTIKSVTARNRQTGTDWNTPLNSITGQAEYQLVVDSTTPAAWWWIGAIASFVARPSQPLAPFSSLPPTSAYTSEVTPVTFDTVTSYVPLAVDIEQIEPSLAETSNQAPCVTLSNLDVYDPNGAGVDVIRWGASVFGSNIRIDRTIDLVGAQAETTLAGCTNCLFAGGFVGTRLGSGFWYGIGGAATTSASGQWSPSGAIVLDGDLALPGGTWGLPNGGTLGLVENKGAIVIGGSSVVAEITGGFSPTAIWPDAGSLVVNGAGRLSVDTSINGSYEQTIYSSLTMNGATVACRPSFVCDAGVTAATLDDAGALFNPGGATITNNLQ